ncbi:hypothetical protein ABZT10_40505, partial [Streptomyces sp900116325]
MSLRTAVLTAVAAGAVLVPSATAVASVASDGEWYRLLTGAFLHLPPGDSSFGSIPFGVLH